MVLSGKVDGIWACRGNVVHCRLFAEPDMLLDMLIVIGPSAQGGKILEVHAGRDEEKVCSRLKLQTEDIVRLQVNLLSVLKSSTRRGAP